MQCADVGVEIWLLFAVSSFGVVLCLFAARPFREWLRERRTTYPSLRAVPGAFFGESGVWMIRALGVIPALMWIASIVGVYCFFHGPR
jgi:hypothetical protein